MTTLKIAKPLKQYWKSFDQHPKTSWGFSIFGLLLICSIAFLWNLGNTGLVDETEPLFAEAARQMVLTGDWITPYFNGETRFDKPPLVYWLMAVGYQVFGVNEWAVRFPSALAAIALTVGCFLTLRSFGFFPSNFPVDSRQKTRQLWLSAWIGSAIAAFNPETLIWARQGVSDMLLSGCMGTALFCFFWGYVEEGKKTTESPEGFSLSQLFLDFSLPNKWYLSFYIFLGLAVLAKGPVGLVLPGLILTSFCLYLGNFRNVLHEVKPLVGGIIFTIIALPWYVLVILRNGQTYIDSFFGYHNIQRFTNVVNGHAAPWYFYFLVVLIGFMPWSIYLPLAIIRSHFWQRSFWRQQPRDHQLGLFGLFWLVGIFIFFSISVTKLPSYVLPAMPAASILIALLFSESIIAHNSEIQEIKASKNRGILFTGGFNILFLVILGIASLYSPQFIGSDPAIIDLPAVVEKSGLHLRGGIIWLITAILIAWILRYPNQWRWLIAANLAGFMAFFMLLVNPAIFLIDEVRQLPLRQISQQISQLEKPQEELWMIGFRKPSVVYYSERHVVFYTVLDFFKGLMEDQPIYNLFDSIQNRPNPSTIMVISRLKELERLGLQDQDYQILEEKGRYLLIRVEKKMLLDRVLNLP
ncbi:glycosyltransferase family 39 protein [Limnoraphis robusta Tam1]|uniref:ArnT family glycosyltransferase n=1 Tax=Limnoraphis robusta TaxID=1118279 RepID=UPI002B210DCC|nr:glycosyltransferase family 39 protein [Limnoraphis robusta]MEA5539870.1 glycosyltransferase family 39 protein [Limnoraphis robusta Tam1]